jgi:uncharacterized protein
MIDHGVSAKRLLEFASSSRILDAALVQAESLQLRDWWIVGGAIRDIIWSLLEGRDPVGLIKDMDLIYFDQSDCSRARDEEIEALLISVNGIPWSVKNQARMHVKSNDAPYSSCQEALYCAPETISAVAITRTGNSQWIVASSFGYEDLLSKILRPTPHFMSKHFLEDYNTRVRSKGWLDRWPSARVLPW